MPVPTSVTSVPAVIDPDSVLIEPMALVGSAIFYGPFYHSGNLYYVLFNYTINKPLVMKSADNGATWTEPDSANAPLSVFGMFVCDPRTSGTPDRLTFAILNAGNLAVCHFDMSTDTWGVASATVAIANIAGCYVNVEGSGTVTVMYSKTGGGNIIGFIQYNGAWGAPVTVIAGTGGKVKDLISAFPVGGEYSMFYVTSDVAGSFNQTITYVHVSSTGVASGSTVIYTGVPTEAFNQKNVGCFSPTLGANGTYVIPVMCNYFGMSFQNLLPRVVVGNPTDGWAVVSLDPGATTVPAGSSSSVLTAATYDGGILAVWNSTDSTITGIPNQLWGSRYDGVSWTDPVLIYDAVADPPPGTDAPSDSQHMGFANITFDSSGLFRLMTTINVSGGFRTSSAGFYGAFNFSPAVNTYTNYIMGARPVSLPNPNVFCNRGVKHDCTLKDCTGPAMQVGKMVVYPKPFKGV